RAPHTEVRIVRFAGPVHTAAHHRDRDRMILRVLGHLLDLVREIDERLVLDARAGGTTDDVHPLLFEARNGAEAAVLDVVENLAPDGHFVALVLEGESE